MTEDEIALYERARSFANFYVHSVELQIKRIREPVGHDDKFILRPIADFHYLASSITRLERAAYLIQKIPSLWKSLEPELDNFKAAIPDIKKLRDIGEHFDDYVLEKGRNKSISAADVKAGLQVFSGSNAEFEWLDAKIVFDDCLLACGQLFSAIRALYPPKKG